MSRPGRNDLFGSIILAMAASLTLAGASAHEHTAGRHAAPHRVPGRVGPAKTGMASAYARRFQCARTANGEVFDARVPTAASKTLPLPSHAEVTNLTNGRSTRVRVNDRGPYVRHRIVDLSPAAASKLGFSPRGTAKVSLRYLGPAPVKRAETAKPRRDCGAR
ncbi:MAG: septal ring lytic transglycosylase RlpA family protein [Caulobacteraceae bacterium]|nr:septal ring lytic transglycosylase RlpA family protein [Caulobacteraceae bacterium]